MPRMLELEGKLLNNSPKPLTAQMGNEERDGQDLSSDLQSLVAEPDLRLQDIGPPRTSQNSFLTPPSERVWPLPYTHCVSTAIQIHVPGQGLRIQQHLPLRHHVSLYCNCLFICLCLSPSYRSVLGKAGNPWRGNICKGHTVTACMCLHRSDTPATGRIESLRNWKVRVHLDLQPPSCPSPLSCAAGEPSCQAKSYPDVYV